MNRRAALAVLATAVLGGGCSAERLVAARAERESVELDAVPFFAQTTHHCGPAALAEALGASGVSAGPDALANEVYVPGLKGSLEAELMASARRHGRIAYRIRPSLGALVAELDAGRPVLVLQNFGVASVPAWHYALVVGYERAGARMLLRSGAVRRDAVATARFDATWRRADRWGIVIVKPDELPAGAEVQAWLTAALELGATAGDAAAAPAYRTAISRWPESSAAWLAFGNERLAAGDLGGAESAFTAATRARPSDPAARNNLALLLARRGCRRAAIAAIERARADAHGTALEAEVDDSARQIGQAVGLEPAMCPSADAVH